MGCLIEVQGSCGREHVSKDWTVPQKDVCKQDSCWHGKLDRMASISKKNCFCDKNMIRVYTTELEQTLEHSRGTICFAIFSHRVYSIPTMAIRHPPHTYKKVVLFGTPCSVWDFSSRGPSTDPRELLPIRCHLLQAGFRVTLYSHLPVPHAAQLSVCSLGGHLPSRKRAQFAWVVCTVGLSQNVSAEWGVLILYYLLLKKKM